MWLCVIYGDCISLRAISSGFNSIVYKARFMLFNTHFFILKTNIQLFSEQNWFRMYKVAFLCLVTFSRCTMLSFCSCINCWVFRHIIRIRRVKIEKASCCFIYTLIVLNRLQYSFVWYCMNLFVFTFSQPCTTITNWSLWP